MGAKPSSLAHRGRFLIRVLVGGRVALRGPHPRPPVPHARAPRVRARHRRVRVEAVVVVVQGVRGVVLRVLQPRDQSLVFISELAAHQRRFAHHHHVLRNNAKTTISNHGYDNLTSFLKAKSVVTFIIKICIFEGK